MKKLLTLVPALLLVVSLSMTAFASPVTNEGKTPSSITVNGIYDAGSVADESISVDITWGKMEFTYSEGSRSGWNPETHEYAAVANPGWVYEEGENIITVTNHSNVDVTASFAFEAAEGVDVTGSFTTDSFDLSTAVDTAVGEAPFDTTAFTIDGGSIAESGAIGTITVTVGKAQNTGYDASTLPVYEVATAEDLLAAVGPERVIKLTDFIDLGESTLWFQLPNDAVAPTLNLNSYTLTGSGNSVINIVSGIVYIESGTIQNTGSGYAVDYSGEYLSLENLKLDAVSTSPSFRCAGNCVVAATSFSWGHTENKEIELVAPGRITAYQSMPLSGPIETPEGTEVIFEWGTYNIDPRNYTVPDCYIVIENGDGTWTVTDPAEQTEP